MLLGPKLDDPGWLHRVPEETEVGGIIFDKSIGFSECSLGNLFFFELFLEAEEVVFVDVLGIPWRQFMDFFNDEGVVERPEDEVQGLWELYSLKTSVLCSLEMWPHQKQAWQSW